MLIMGGCPSNYTRKNLKLYTGCFGNEHTARAWVLNNLGERFFKKESWKLLKVSLTKPYGYLKNISTLKGIFA